MIYAMIIGAMKAGTTSLFDALVSHPQVEACRVKEPEYFSERHGKPIQVARYESLWIGNKPGAKVRLEASAGYTKYPYEPHVPERILAYGVEPRFIYVVRDPIRRIVSHINYMQLKSGWQLEDQWEHLVSISSYCAQLDRFSRVFGQSKILVVRLEDLLANPVEQMGICTKFLGLSAFLKFDGIPHSNDSSESSVLARRISSLPLAGVRRAMPASVKLSVKGLLARINPPIKFALESRAEANIRNALLEDMNKLHLTYGVDVAQWGFG